MSPNLTLVVLRGKSIGRTFPLGPGENLIGRWDPERGAFPEVDLEEVDSDARVSRRHAVLHVRDSDCVIEDIGSLNGTYINSGSRIETGVPHKLEVGDEIHLGGVVLALSFEEVSTANENGEKV